MGPKNGGYAVQTTGLLAGSLAPLTPATVPAGFCPGGIAVNHTSTTVYVTSGCDDTLLEYRIGSNGTLTQIGTVHTVGEPYVVAAAPDDKAVYVATLTGEISQYAASATTGLLTADNPPNVLLPGANASGRGIVVSPNSASVYVADLSDGTLDHFAAAKNGTLTLKDVQAPAGSRPIGVAVSTTGKTVYATDRANHQILEYSASATGALTPAGAVATGLSPTGIAVAPSDKNAYAINTADNTIWTYKISGTKGLLTAIGTPLVLPPGALAFGLAVRK